MSVVVVVDRAYDRDVSPLDFNIACAHDRDITDRAASSRGVPVAATTECSVRQRWRACSIRSIIELNSADCERWGLARARCLASSTSAGICINLKVSEHACALTASQEGASPRSDSAQLCRNAIMSTCAHQASSTHTFFARRFGPNCTKSVITQNDPRRDRGRHCRCSSPSTLHIHCKVGSGRRRGTPASFVDRLEDRLDVSSTWGSDLVFLPR